MSALVLNRVRVSEDLRGTPLPKLCLSAPLPSPPPGHLHTIHCISRCMCVLFLLCLNRVLAYTQT